MDVLPIDTGLLDQCWGTGRQAGAYRRCTTCCVSLAMQLLCIVIGSDWVMLSDNWADNDSGAYQCQQIGSQAECMIAITALVMFRTTMMQPVTFACRDNNSQSVSIFVILLFPTYCPPSAAIPSPSSPPK